MSEPLKVIAGAPDRPLVIGDIEIPCYVLEDETRVLSQRGVTESVGISGGTPANQRAASGVRRLPGFLSGNALKPHCSAEMIVRANSPIEFAPTSGGRGAYGYPATLLVDICNAVLDARNAGDLRKNQLHIADRCELLMRGFATVGIIALVDEATGYQRIREKRALATILEKFIDKELHPWTKMFPYEFYEEIFRLKGWSGPEGVKRPSVIGKYTNNIVYDRLAPGVREELQRVNPTTPAGYRKNRHHQWFTRDIGHPKLKEHLIGVIALMKASANWGAFQRNLTRVYPKMKEPEQIPMHEHE